MEQHPIPRQITTFEFKLIGFMTLKQFLYLVVFVPLGIIIYLLFPIPFLNILLAIIIGSLGPIFAFVPIMDRSVDVWLRNLYKRLISPTQFVYKKNNPPIYFLKDLYFDNNPHIIMAHIDSQEKLNRYLANKKIVADKTNQQKKTTISGLLNQKNLIKTNKNQTILAATKTTGAKKPYLTGVVKNHKMIPLPGILIYIKDQKNKPVRLLKTNPHGVFATFGFLPAGDYFFEIKDPNNNYFFDTIKINISSKIEKPMEIFSKELI